MLELSNLCLQQALGFFVHCFQLIHAGHTALLLLRKAFFYYGLAGRADCIRVSFLILAQQSCYYACGRLYLSAVKMCCAPTGYACGRLTHQVSACFHLGVQQAYVFTCPDICLQVKIINLILAQQSCSYACGRRASRARVSYVARQESAGRLAATLLAGLLGSQLCSQVGDDLLIIMWIMEHNSHLTLSYLVADVKGSPEGKPARAAPLWGQPAKMDLWHKGPWRALVPLEKQSFS